MNNRTVRWTLLALVAVVIVVGYLVVPPESDESGAPATTTPAASTERRPDASDGIKQRVENAVVKNYDKVVFRGTVDLAESIERIRDGVKHPHRNDGSVFGNRERLLPNRPRGYYREYVHPTEGISGAGPQRLVVGRDGDWWYTPDHYASFIPLGKETR